MENKKINIGLTTIIISAVIIGIAILCIIFFVIYTRSNLPKLQDTQQDSNTFNSNEQTNSNSSLNNVNSIDNSDSSNIIDNTISTEPEPDSSSEQATSVTGETSSKSSPLSIGQWGIASKYNFGNYVDIPVKITNVVRGDSAAQIVENYCNSSSSIYKYEDAKDGMEWAIIDYTVDLTNIDGYSMGKDIKVDSKITGTGDNTSIHYNDNIYIVSTMNMTSGYSKENIANGQFAAQLPIGCTDYLITLGSASSTQAFFAGE